MTSNLFAAIVAAQKSFGPALKSAVNPHFKSRYADLASVIDAVLESLNANGIALVQDLHECDNGVIVETLFLHESGESRSFGKLHIPALKQDAPAYGSALTYARRYAIMAACGVAPEDDDGSATMKQHKAVVPPLYEAEKAALRAARAIDMAAFRAAWIKLDAPTQKALASYKDALKNSPSETGAAATFGGDGSGEMSAAPGGGSRTRQPVTLSAHDELYARMVEAKLTWEQVATAAQAGGLFVDPTYPLEEMPADVATDVLGAWDNLVKMIGGAQ